MRLALLLIMLAFASCRKSGGPEGCGETGTIKTGSELGLWCKEMLFIVDTENSIFQPVIAAHLVNGFSEGDQVTFGYREVFVALMGCGDNVKTVELLCVKPVGGDGN